MDINWKKELLEKYAPIAGIGYKQYPILLANVTYQSRTRHKKPRIKESTKELIITSKDFENDDRVISQIRNKFESPTKDISIISYDIISEHGLTNRNAFGEDHGVTKFPTKKDFKDAFTKLRDMPTSTDYEGSTYTHNQGKFKLFDYIKDMVDSGMEILKDNNMVIYALEMRLGKTHASLETCKISGYKTVLFLTPKIAISSVLDDYKKARHDFELEVINYESLHKVKNKKPDAVICDEFHKIGSSFPRPSDKARALKSMLSYDPPTIYLSGTPTPESYSQIYHSLFISPSSPFKDYINFYSWAKKYVKVYDRKINGNNIKFYNHAIKSDVLDAYQHLIVSYTQKEAGFPFEVKDVIHHVKMKDGTYALANVIKKDKLYEPKDGGVIMADTPAKMMSKLHQIYSGTVIKENDDGKTEKIFFDDSKISYIRKAFSGRRIAIFYVFDREGDALRKEFPESTDDHESFQRKESETYIAQIRSVKEGVKLDTADELIFYNIGFSSTEYTQARQRIQSIDRVSEPRANFIFCDGGIEDKVYKVVKSKKNFTSSYYNA